MDFYSISKILGGVIGPRPTPSNSSILLTRYIAHGPNLEFPPGLPQPVIQIIQEAISGEPAQRPTMAVIAETLRGIEEG